MIDSIGNVAIWEGLINMRTHKTKDLEIATSILNNPFLKMLTDMLILKSVLNMLYNLRCVPSQNVGPHFR